jgi:hypothetical protein
MPVLILRKGTSVSKVLVLAGGRRTAGRADCPKDAARRDCAWENVCEQIHLRNRPPLRRW